MLFKQNQLFRRAIIPWYDSTSACLSLMIFAAVIMIFAATGIKVALTTAIYTDYVWFPCMLLFLCLIIIIKVAGRLITRSRHS
ncbi:MAG: hypothetical protein U9N77_03165 [Thermodesulfobacteriota bacterium]|nr:hypothetical protein [Thermodesulfobacteriota bacterium]